MSVKLFSQQAFSKSKFAPTNVFPTTNLVARYETPPSSGSTWTDTVGGYNLTLSGTTYNSSVSGNLTMGNGTNNSFSIDGTTSYTFAMWVNPTSLGGTTYSTMSPLFGLSSVTSPGSLVIGASTSGLIMNGYTNNGFGPIGSVATNTWQLLTFCLVAGNTVASDVYVNSSLVSGAGVAGYGSSKPAPLTIGKTSTLNTNNWQGYFGSFYIWNKKLNLTEVSDMFTVTRGRFGV